MENDARTKVTGPVSSPPSRMTSPRSSMRRCPLAASDGRDRFYTRPPARPLARSPEQALPAQQDNGWVCGDDDDFDATHSAISRSSEAQQPPIPSQRSFLSFSETASKLVKRHQSFFFS